MADLFGFTPPPVAFTDIRNQHPTTAEKKAILCDQLRVALRKVPDGICNADVKTVREWREHYESAKKTLGKPRSSVNELTAALKQMKSYR